MSIENKKIFTKITTVGSTFIFTSDGGGMADQIIHEDTGDRFVCKVPAGGELTLVLADGRVLHPDASNTIPEIYQEDDVDVVEFIDLPWCDDTGKIISDFHLALKHEVNTDGLIFTTAMLHVESSSPPEVKSFTLTRKFRLDAYDDVRYAALPRQAGFASHEIQSATPVNFLQIGQNTNFARNLLTQASFYAYRHNDPSLYLEAFLEGGATLSGDIRHGSSQVSWNGKEVDVTWDFQTAVLSGKRPYQWRNRWGSIIAPPVKKRTLSPQTIYQFIDNYRHYPTDSELETLVKAGCGILVLHSNWRRDAKNGGVPYSIERFREIVDFAHRHDIRVAVYIRGNELAIKEDAAIWFDRYLRKDYDGLYLDYGCPCGFFTSPDEDYPGGIVHYRGLYQTLRCLRQRVGKHGFLFSHTGPAFSSVGMSLCDGYISGEAERGMLIMGRMEYEYFTKAAAAAGTLWSAAFPEYSSLAIIPFIASAGQAPHNPLGVQFKSSSLQHPPEPGINDHAFRPLWKLWRLFADETNIHVFADYNSAGVFTAESGDHGHYLMISSDYSRALLIISRFGSAQSRTRINWEKTGFKPGGTTVWRLSPNVDSPGVPEVYSDDLYALDLEDYPAGAFLLSHKSEDFSDYIEPYPKTGSTGELYLKAIEEQQQLRDIGQTDELFLTLELDNSICTALENSNYFDLFDSILQLVEFDDAGTCRVLGTIGKNNFYPTEMMPSDDQLRPGDTSSVIPLHNYLEKGKHRLGIRTLHLGEPFYSFVSVWLEYNGKKSKLDFYNDIEPDRSLLSFSVEFI